MLKRLEEVENDTRNETGTYFYITADDINVEYDAKECAVEIRVDCVILDRDYRRIDESIVAYRINTSDIDEDWEIGTLEDAKEALREYIKNEKEYVDEQRELLEN